MVLTDRSLREVRPDLPVTIVAGGGIAGLYTAYLLGKAGYPVTVLERSDRWGGRIESVQLPSGADTPFLAEFGPMRFEPLLQERFARLAYHLGLDFTPFAPTTAPACPTDYELSDVEASFPNASLLLMWAVLRMFYGNPSAEALAAVPDGEVLAEGPRESLALRTLVDALFEGDYATVQDRLDTMRQHHRLGGSRDARAPRLRDIGMWNALAEILTPGALAKVRDSGTFYHLLGHNLSAVEWGIFWLRQASSKGASIQTLTHAPEGIWTVVDRLLARLQQECPTVQLRLGQQVVRLQHAKHPGELEVRVEDRTGGGAAYSLRADHVILALPQAALKKLAEDFPDDVRQDLDRVWPLPLLKAFLVTTRPWWGHHFNAQSHAWLVPTRELHYFTKPEAPDCPREQALRNGDPRAVQQPCQCPPVTSGMVMLYTDMPAIDFWRPFIGNAQQERAHLYGYGGLRGDGRDEDADERLKRALVRQLLVEANPDITTKINIERRRVEAELQQRFGSRGDDLVRAARADGVTLAAVLQAHLRSCTPDDCVPFEAMFRDLFGEDESWVETLLAAMEPALPKDQLTEAFLDSIVAYGIRDWSREPIGGAAHAWLPGADSVAIGRRLAAFGLRGRPDIQNVHICGEAYSDFQGFIEGALTTATRVCQQIAATAPQLALPPALPV